MAASSRLITVRDGEPVRYPSQQSRVGLTPGNPHAFPWIRIWRGRRALAQLSAADVRCRACLMAYSQRACSESAGALAAGGARTSKIRATRSYWRAKPR